MEEVHTMLLRMRELAVQASNGTYTTQDRVALRAEIHDLQEIKRIGDDTTWNNLNMLSRSKLNWYNVPIGCR